MGKRIMIVEDEAVTCRRLEIILLKLGYEVCAKAQSGSGAIQQAGECQPDLILMDINLSGEIDGIEAAATIQETHNIPVIYVTAFDNPEILGRAKVTEPYNYILKPVQPRDLYLAIEIALFKHQAVTEKLQLQAQLNKAKQMAMLDTFVGGLSQELNNILWLIIGFTDLTLLTTSADSQEYQNLKTVLSASEKAKELVDQFVMISRRFEPERQPLRFDHIIEESTEFLAKSIDMSQQIDIIKNIAPSHKMILANASRLQEMLQHLYSNAIHAMQDNGGKLAITLEELFLENKQLSQFQGIRPDYYFKFTVADSGHGMDESLQERAFEPFFTTKEVGEGKGMGLALVNGIVKQHGGVVTLSSKYGQGTTLTILLPCWLKCK